MKPTKNRLSVLTVLFGIGLSAIPAAAQTFTTIDDPLGTKGTYACGVSGSNVVGYYFDCIHYFR